MQRELLLQLSPKDAADSDAVTLKIAASLGVNKEKVTGFHLLKKSIDARRKDILINLKLNAFVDEPFRDWERTDFVFPEVGKADKQVIIIGAGPAGLFAALELIQQGIKPIVLERGKNVRERRRDLAVLNKEGILNEDSNYCFGEGGAGTYSDGKLYTRSTKRGNVEKVLQMLVFFGADASILYTAHPHIGTNKLPHIITAMREHIIQCGGIIHFETRMTDLVLKNDKVIGIKTHKEDIIDADVTVLATGHSARDIFTLLHKKNIEIEAKPFALGVRIEHPQSLIDSIQYHCKIKNPFLPPAAYSWVEQVNAKGVFSFCMCPGGIIAPASTAPGEVVVNGWSPSKRNNPFANSGIVVSVSVEEISTFLNKQPHPLIMMEFQQQIEQSAFKAGGSDLKAPAQRMLDFTEGSASNNLPDCSYHPGIQSVQLKEVLPSFITNGLRNAFIQTGKKMKGYLTNEAVLVATESRTSSPVRIPRDVDTLEHKQIKGLYPCGEGAGYAGGIISAAMDGEKVAEAIAHVLR